MDKKKRFSFDDLFMNNKLVFFMSLFIAVFLWVTISMTVGPEETRVIENVRVILEEDENSTYTAFGFEETFVDVTVKGKKYLVTAGALSDKDITVTASSSYIDSAGVKKLKLNAKINKSDDIKITGLSQTTVEVFYDVEKTGVFPIEPVIKAESDVVPDGYIYEEPILAVSTVTVSGPATQINNIEKIRAVAKIESPITTSQELPVKLSAVLANGKKAQYLSYEADTENMTVTVPVSMVKEMPVTVRYVNIPSYYENNMPEVNIYPKTVKVAAAQSVLESMDSLVVGSVNFNQLTNKNNKFTFSLSDIEEVYILSDVKEVSVNINCYPMKTKTFSITDDAVTFLNTPDYLEPYVVRGVIKDITVVGPSAELQKLDNESIMAKVDLANAGEGTNDYEAIVYIKGNDKCWVYGTYSVRLKMTVAD